MNVADERGVRRALAFAHMLEHEHIVRCCGSWEDEKALYIVEEYALKGDLLQVRAGRGRGGLGLCLRQPCCVPGISPRQVHVSHSWRRRSCMARARAVERSKWALDGPVGKGSGLCL